MMGSWGVLRERLRRDVRGKASEGLTAPLTGVKSAIHYGIRPTTPVERFVGTAKDKPSFRIYCIPAALTRRVPKFLVCNDGKTYRVRMKSEGRGRGKYRAWLQPTD